MLRITTVVLAVAVAALPLAASAAQEEMDASYSKQYIEESADQPKSETKSRPAKKMSATRKSSSKQVASAKKATSRRSYTAKYETQKSRRAPARRTQVSRMGSCPGGVCPVSSTAAARAPRTMGADRATMMRRGQYAMGGGMGMMRGGQYAMGGGMGMMGGQMYGYTGGYGMPMYTAGYRMGWGETCRYSCPGRIVYGEPRDWCNMGYEYCW